MADGVEELFGRDANGNKTVRRCLTDGESLEIMFTYLFMIEATTEGTLCSTRSSDNGPTL